MYRYLIIKYSFDAKKDKIKKLKEEIKNNIKELNKRKVKVKYIINKKRNDLFQIDLIGYDGKIKYRTNKTNEIKKIIKLIDKMPMGKIEKIKRIELYTNAHKKNTIKGTGYKNEEKAKYTIKIIKKLPLYKQFQIINVLYNRAKYHPHKTNDIKKAMKIFNKWLKKYELKKKNKK